MSHNVLRAATGDDADAIVALNAAVVAVTSPMDAAGFAMRLAIAGFCQVVEREGAVIGFILAMRDGAPYANGNFQWFSDRLRRFVYIDRVVIGERARGQGLGTVLYDALEQAARRDAMLSLAAEMDLQPANHASLAFHARRGFVPLGTRTLPGGKIVSMQIMCLESL